MILLTLPSGGGMGNWVLVYLLPLREGAASLPEVAWTLWRNKSIVRRHKGAKRGQWYNKVSVITVCGVSTLHGHVWTPVVKSQQSRNVILII